MIPQRQLEDLYRNVRDRLKRGKLDGFHKTDILTIDKLVKSNPKSLSCPFDEDSLQYAFFKLQSLLKVFRESQDEHIVNANPLYLKALSISFEFRDYLEELSADDVNTLGELSSRFLSEFRQTPPKLLTHNDREVLKEKVRLVSTFANQLRREHRYEQAAKTVKVARDIIVKELRPKGSQANTVLAGLYYVESKLFRHHGQYKKCEERLTRAIESYLLWLMRNTSDHKNIQLASYKIALYLGDIAWSKNSRGFCSDALALISAARLLLLPTGWELDKARMDLFYAEVERAVVGTDSKMLESATEIADRSYRTFKKHAHKRLTSRSAFTLAVLNFYGGNLETSLKRLNEVGQFSEQTGNTKWLINYWNLLARIMIKQGKAREALSLLNQSIDKAIDAKLTNQQVVAQIARADAYCLLGNYEEAIKSLNEAGKIYQKRIEAGSEVNNERNNGWILLSLAQTYLLRGDVRQAKIYLERWEHLKGVEYKWLHDKAKQIREDVEARSSQDFIICSDTDSLNWETHRANLALWLENQASMRRGSKKNEVIAKELGVDPRHLGNIKRRPKT